MAAVGYRMESEAPMNRLMLIAVTMLACLPAAAGAGVIYQYDDGTENTQGGLGGVYLAWMVRFTVQPDGDTINAVEISLHNAGSFDAVVWRDIGGNGNPADARVLSRTPFTGVVGWNTIDITPVTVSGSFFVGAYSPPVYYPIDFNPIDADYHGAAPQRSWMAVGLASLDLDNLTGADLFQDMGNDYGAVAMVRAQATPEPATMALLAAGGIAALLRRRRK
jgi:hypothetical protein